MLQRVVQIAQHLARPIPLNVVELRLCGRWRDQYTCGNNACGSKLFQHRIRMIIHPFMKIGTRRKYYASRWKV
jgi:hypothetical protein